MIIIPFKYFCQGVDSCVGTGGAVVGQGGHLGQQQVTMIFGQGALLWERLVKLWEYPCTLHNIGVILQKVWAHCEVFRESLTILGTGV